MHKWVFINQDFVQLENSVLHISDLAFTRGYGIFDFLKVMKGIPLFVEDHLDRFYSSASYMHLPINRTREELKQVIELLVAKNGLPDCGIRITLTGGYSGDGYTPAEPNLVVSSHSFKLPADPDIKKGIRLMTWPFQRQLPEVKTIDYLMAIWLQPLMKKEKADDILYVNDGYIRECPRANIFVVTPGNKILTPGQNILKGITRKKILGFASALYALEERDISLEELQEAREVFICSTTKNILPVSRINGWEYTTEGHITIQLQEMLLRELSGLSVLTN